MRSKLFFLLVLCLLVLVPRLAAAEDNACDTLTGAKRTLAESVLKSQHPYACCDDTIWNCLRQKPVCRLARRLADDVCRRAAAGQRKAEIERELARRASSMTGATYKIDLSAAEPAGEAGAKVKVVAYVCARCPYCAKLMPELHSAVASGKLKGKASLYVRPFPIRSHRGSSVGGMAMMAAQKLGHFWAMLPHMYAHFAEFDPARLADSAADAGMDRAGFAALLTDEGLKSQLKASKKEGIRNKVKATPTIFIGGRKYYGDLSFEALEDVILEEHERRAGLEYVKPGS